MCACKDDIDFITQRKRQRYIGDIVGLLLTNTVSIVPGKIKLFMCVNDGL